ncbi:dihydrofolate reductase [Aspergillus candidus]|uniref:Dihydrofolate reductase n=1 Tax=Aspergillus candidus TaxID=41067 RepID=A0A2I2FFT7_ASPCN|nr:dihydrofolate reductase-like domain-containing protein [Aspergillus candidus]PLB39494.1 dihydrofolate reductase-like domain-containing protein [Aspergillus candidus]
MPPSTAQKPLTLIVATTPIPQTHPKPTTRLGIGLNGTLPWPRIKADMSFFARVTTRTFQPRETNAMIMGRKTYDSVPAHLRPLGKRMSVVVSRDASGAVGERVRRELEEKRGREGAKAAADAAKAADAGKAATVTGEGQATDAVVCSGLENALEMLENGPEVEGRLGQVFVIGGAEIYGSALRLEGGRPLRIVMTYVEKKEEGAVFECDTFFPVDEELESGDGWRRVSADEVSGWVGEEVTGEWRDEGEVRVRMVGYERLQ